MRSGLESTSLGSITTLRNGDELETRGVLAWLLLQTTNIHGKLCQPEGAGALDNHVVDCHCEQKADLKPFPPFPTIRKVTVTAIVLCSKIQRRQIQWLRLKVKPVFSLAPRISACYLFGVDLPAAAAERASDHELPRSMSPQALPFLPLYQPGISWACFIGENQLFLSISSVGRMQTLDRLRSILPIGYRPCVITNFQH